MAIATAVSIGTSNKVTVDYQSQEVSVSVTFELERSDADLQAFVNDKAAEVERAHSAVWRRIREIRAEQKAAQASANGSPSAEPQVATEGDAKAPTSPPNSEQPAKAREDDSDPFADPRPRRGRNGRKPVNGVPQPGVPDESSRGGSACGDGQSQPLAESHGVPAQAPAEPPAGAAADRGNGSAPLHSGNDSVRVETVPFGPTDTASSLAQQRAILSLAARAGLNDRTFAALLQEQAGKSNVEQLTRQEAARLLVAMQRRDRTAAAPAA